MLFNDEDVLARIRELEVKVAVLQDDVALDGVGRPRTLFGVFMIPSSMPKVSVAVNALIKYLGLRLNQVPAKNSEWELVQVKSPPNKRMKLTPRKASRKSK